MQFGRCCGIALAVKQRKTERQHAEYGREFHFTARSDCAKARIGREHAIELREVLAQALAVVAHRRLGRPAD